VTTSGVYTWSLTFLDLATQAAYELGAIAQGDVPEAQEASDMMLRFNAMLKSWDGTLFRDVVSTVTMIGGAGSVAAPAGTRDITSVRHVVSATYNRQLAEWNRSEFYAVPNRVQAGDPVAYYIDKTSSGLTIRVWPVPASNVTLELDRQKSAETVTDPSQTIDVPEEWQETLIMGLASRCAAIFGTTRIDPGTVQRIDAKAAVLYQKMLDRDRPSSYYFEPDC
jgi:hypothetical protein